LAVEVLDGADAGTRFGAESDRLTIGTALGNDLVLKDEAVSGFHLELLRCSGGIQITDLESTNGTWLGSVRIARACAAPGTELLIGRTRIRISEGADTAVEVCRR
jgi:pSer/pThr/pTyr-binding forkhead associated (FHA) protein